MQEDLEKMADVLRELDVTLSTLVQDEAKKAPPKVPDMTLRDWLAVAFACRGTRTQHCYKNADEVLSYR